MKEKIILLFIGLLVFQGSYSQPAEVSRHSWADSVLHQMSLDEKIGQLFMIAAYSNKNENYENELEKQIRLADRVDSVIQKGIQEGKITGACVGIYQNQEEYLRKAYGLADREQETPMRTDTLFRIFSMTKPVTAVATMQLWESGKLELSDCSKMPLLADALRKEGFTEDEVEAIFFRNAQRFFENNL